MFTTRIGVDLLPAGRSDDSARKTEQITIRFPVADLTVLFGQFYKGKFASDFIAEHCRLTIHAVADRVRLTSGEAAEVGGAVALDSLAKQIADQLLKGSRSKPPTGQA